MSIDKTKYCNTHNEEKKESGKCCQMNEQQVAEQTTYEYYPKIHELAKANPHKTYRELEKEINER